MKTAAEISAMADEYAFAREERLAVDKRSKELKEREEQLKRELVQAMKDSETSVTGGKIFSVKHRISMEPTPENWGEIWKHIRETGETDLVYQRLNAAALKERLDSGVNIRGVGWFPVDKLSISKVK